MTGLLAAAVLAVLVHNTTDVPKATLRQAQMEVERIYAEAGVTIAWNIVQGGQDGTSDFPIHIIVRRQPGGGPGAGSPSALGTTLGDDNQRGGVSFVFYERVLKLAHRYQQPAALILAYAMAHEMGHVLLPAPAHTTSGLMKPDWDGDDVRRMTTGGKPFTAQQIAFIRAAIEGYRLSAAK